MRKIPTLFLRDENDRRYVTREINPAAAWVLEGEARATRKFDGTCVMLDDAGHWWARREVKQGKPFPSSYLPEETDPNTGKAVGWESIEQSPFIKAFQDAGQDLVTVPGTYELCGPKVNGNPESYPRHVLLRHGSIGFLDVPTDYDGLRAFLARIPDAEGIVWHNPDGRMAKIKRRDFPR